MCEKNNQIPKSCRLCGASQESQIIRAATVFGGRAEHNFWQCRSCDAVYLYPVPSIEEETYFYKKEFEKFMSSRSGQERDWSNAEAHIQTNQDQVSRRWKFLAPFLEPGMDILEIGCSSGFMLNAFREEGLHCVGIEPSGEFIEFLHSNGYETYQTLELLKESHSEPFDLVVHFFVFEHIRDPFQFLEENLKLLKPGGKIIAEIPCVNDPLTSLYTIPAFEKFYWSIAHHYYYSPKSLSYVLDKLDLKYEMLPEQRYDLSNHIVWMTEGKPGGQGRYSHIFSDELLEKYKQDLKKNWLCDTIILYVYK
ncbi:Ubiquinone biosynthesis O-methyltransferase, mitochondrial [subsurface metagenome]